MIMKIYRMVKLTRDDMKINKANIGPISVDGINK